MSAPARAHSDNETQEAVRAQIRFDQKLNAQIPLDAAFRDETGRSVQLHEYFGKKSVMLVPLYYKCAMLCPEEMSLLSDSLNEIKFDPGKQFELVLLSIDPRETPADAAATKKDWIQRYGRPGTEAGWHLLVGKEAEIKRVTQAIGFGYAYDAKKDEYAHPDGLVIVTPMGKIARYFYGFQYAPRDLRFGLIEASANKIGSPLDYLWLQCYHYNPVTGQYTVGIMGVLRLFSIGLILFGLMWIAASVLRERRATARVRYQVAAK